MRIIRTPIFSFFSFFVRFSTFFFFLSVTGEATNGWYSSSPKMTKLKIDRFLLVQKVAALFFLFAGVSFICFFFSPPNLFVLSFWLYSDSRAIDTTFCICSKRSSSLILYTERNKHIELHAI